MSCYPIAVITGPPGVGKTTMVHKFVAHLGRERPDTQLHGFYTEETRQSGVRTGFEVVTLTGQRAVLAAKSGRASQPKVGAYSVDVSAFESLALPFFKKSYGPSDVLIIDEVGRMELLSSPFTAGVRGCLQHPPCPMVVTLPAASGRGRPLPLVEAIRAKAVTVVTLNVSERSASNDQLVIDQLTKHLFRK